MSRFPRKTAPGVRAGRTQHKNNWRASPSWYRGEPPARLIIDRRRPGDGYHHLLLKRDVERFIALIPGWEKFAVGLRLIVLSSGQSDADGWYNQGALGICAWPRQMSHEIDLTWYADHCAFLDRIGARIENRGFDRKMMIHWTEDTARAYQLCHVFLHELGHHADRMHTRTKVDNGPRGEGFAENFAFDLERAVLERYFTEFGWPSQ